MHMEEVAVLAKIPVTIPFTEISFNIVITELIVTSWIIMAVIILWAFLSTRNMKLVPSKLQLSAEFVVDTINGFVKGIVGHKWKSYTPYLGTLALYLALSNTLGALFFAKPPTRDFSIPVALAIMTICVVIGASIKARGFGGFIKKLFKPLPFLFPINLLEYLIKPLSLCMRLFGNIFGAYILMHMIIGAFPVGAPSVACLYFDLFDGGLQAFVFVFLSTLYIAEEVEVEEE